MTKAKKSPEKDPKPAEKKVNKTNNSKSNIKDRIEQVEQGIVLQGSKESKKDVPRRKKGGKLRLTEAERAKRAERMREIGKKQHYEKGRVELAVTGVKSAWNYQDIKDLAEVTGLSTAKVKQIFFDNKSFKDWQKQKMRKLKITGFATLTKLLTIVNSGRLSPYQAGMLFNMIKPSIIEPKKDNAQNIVNIGDNRQVKVYYPNFDKTKPKMPEKSVNVAKTPLSEL